MGQWRRRRGWGLARNRLGLLRLSDRPGAGSAPKGKVHDRGTTARPLHNRSRVGWLTWSCAQMAADCLHDFGTSYRPGCWESCRRVSVGTGLGCMARCLGAEGVRMGASRAHLLPPLRAGGGGEVRGPGLR